MAIVTVNSRLARQLRRQMEREHVAAGDSFWETPDTIAWPQWLSRQWEETIYSGRDSRILLSASQELVLWEQVIRQSGESLLNPQGTAQKAAEAWMLLHNWRLPRREEAFAELPDTAAFFRWMASFQGFLRSRGFITAPEVPEVLLKSGFEQPEAVCGFEEMTPVQRSLLAECDETSLGLPVMPTRHRCGLPDGAEEIRAAARWAREILARNPEARAGIVFPDLASRRTAASRIFEEVLGTDNAFHISAPVPLSEVPITRAAILTLKSCAGLTPAEAGEFFRSPYTKYRAQTGAQLDLTLRKRGTPKFFTSYGGDEIGVAHRPAAWSKEFSRIVKASGWPGPRGLNSYEFQAADAWSSLLGEFARLDAVLGDMSFAAAVSRLERLAAQTGFGPEETGEPIQLMGVAEAAGSRFDALWIGGLHDGAWPPVVRANPFLPLSLQRAAGMPDSSVELAFADARRVTNRLLRSADSVVCSYPQRDGDVDLRPSPFLAGMSECQAKPPAPLPPEAMSELVEGDVAPELGDGRFVQGGMGVIEDQSACPFRAFAKHRLGARALEAFESGLTASERGGVTHAALQRIWEILRSRRRLIEMEAADLSELVRTSVRVALKEKLGESSKELTKTQALEERRLSRLLLSWLGTEKNRPDFEARRLEAAQRSSFGGMELDIRADRVDVYEDGSLAILDYKTGGNDLSPSHWMTDRPKSPQLPLYSILAAEPVSTIAFVRLAAGNLKAVGISERADLELKVGKGYTLRDQIERWRGVLDALGREFVAGHAVVSPAKGQCDYCDLKGLCRIAEIGEDEADE